MGITRKFLSLSTLGAIDFRSDKERTAAYTHSAAKEAKEQTKLMRVEAERAREGLSSRCIPGPVPATLNSSLADELAKLAHLRDAGVLSSEEFETQKARLLG